MAAAAPGDEIPSEIQESLAAFEESLRSAEGTLRSLMSVPRSELVQKLDPVEQAKLDLASAYTLNSMFWIYLITQGVNPKEHAVKQELVIKLPVLFCRFSYSNGCAERIRTYMNKVKEITDRKKASRLDKGVASRIVRSALWEAKAEGGQKRKPKSLPHSKSKK